MAYPFTHWLLAFGGPLYATEQWSCTLRARLDFPGNGQAEEQVVLDDVTDAITTWFPNSPSNAFAKVGFVKVNRVGPDGRYTQSFSNTNELIPPVTGGGTAVTPVPQVALVATLNTEVTRGLASRGRVFLPAPKYSIDGGTGRISAADATAAATSVAALLTSLNSVVGFGPVVVGSDVREGALNDVISVTCGRVLDTMRSRRAQLNEEKPPAVTVGGL